MPITDPIADFLTRIRNAQRVRKATVDVPASKMKVRIAELLAKEGFIGGANLVPGKPGNVLRMSLRYNPNGEPMIQELKRLSRPGCRLYATAEELAAKRGTVTTTIVTTSKGIMTGEAASEANLGGELIMRVM